MINHRNDNADLLKSISIIGVVWIHSFSLNNSLINEQPIADIFRFCVPVFIILWALFYEHGLQNRSKEDGFVYIKQRFVKLGIPFLFWSAVHFFFFYDPANIPFSTILNGHFGGYGWAGQFFLIILFQWTVLLPLIRKYVNWGSTWFVILASLALYYWVAYDLWQVELVQKLGHRLFIYWAPYVFLGIVIAKEGVPKFSVPIILILISTVITVPMEFSIFRSEGISFSPYVMPTVLISSMALTIAVLSIKNMGPLPSVLKAIGKYTFAIFLLNPFVIRIVGPYLQELFSVIYIPVISDIGVSLLILLLCLFLAQVMSRLGLGPIIGQS